MATLFVGFQAEQRPGCSIPGTSAVRGSGEQGVVTLAHEAPCDLLVMGSTHRRFFDSTVLGSATARVVAIRHAQVLMVPMAP